MLAAQLQQQQAFNLREKVATGKRIPAASSKAENAAASDVVHRTDNQDFMREFTQIFYGKERPAPRPEPKQELDQKL